MNTIVKEIGYAYNHLTKAFTYACMQLMVIIFMSVIVHYIIKPLVPEKDKKEISKDTGNYDSIKKESTVYVWSEVFTFAAIEEFIFRFLPLSLLWWFRIRNYIVVGSMILITSVIFGYLHGNYLNILLQGVAGIMYGILFWDFMVDRPKDKFVPFRAFMFVSVVHMFYNLLIFYILLFKK